MRRDFLTPGIVIGGIVIVILALWIVICDGQTSKQPIKNGVLQSDLDAAGYKILRANMADYAGLNMTWNTVTGRFDAAAGGGGGAPTTSTYITQTPDAGLSAEVPLSGLATGLLKSTITTGALTTITDSSTNWNTAFTQTRQWDGGSTGLVAATGRTSLALVPGTNVEVPLTFSTGLTRSTNTVTVNTSQNIATLSNLTTNGFVKTGGAVGTLSVDTATYQASAATLTSWAAITRAAGFDTFATTPSSANLRGVLTDENGTGAALFSGATAPDFTTGFTIGAAAASGKIPIGNGTNYVPSTPTWPNAAGTSGVILQSNGTNFITSTPTWPTTAGAAGYQVRSDGTNMASYPTQLSNSSTTNLTTSTADIYLAGSSIALTAGDFKAKGQYHCVFDMAKTAGTGAIVVTVRVGTTGTVASDAAILTFTFGAGTAVSDSGVFEVWASFRTVGSGTSAVMVGSCQVNHQLATTGLINNAATWPIIGIVSSGFNSSTATTVGVSFNGSTAFAGTNTLVQATMEQ